MEIIALGLELLVPSGEINTRRRAEAALSPSLSLWAARLSSSQYSSSGIPNPHHLTRESRPGGFLGLGNPLSPGIVQLNRKTEGKHRFKKPRSLGGQRQNLMDVQEAEAAEEEEGGCRCGGRAEDEKLSARAREHDRPAAVRARDDVGERRDMGRRG